ncbi:hypothetical protein [Candidatus Roseilinea sp. NK_OTU-006]|uniref:hypothetical protein n=1 Tax=Candidatus Roseilinea sp. NK_OTU-006 TaxID=2704250 RepID=UPI00145D49AA|nr:hypothetical protein [Candidatus Roseilinea sp. NK_OTU-006]
MHAVRGCHLPAAFYAHVANAAPVVGDATRRWDATGAGLRGVGRCVGVAPLVSAKGAQQWFGSWRRGAVSRR